MYQDMQQASCIFPIHKLYFMVIDLKMMCGYYYDNMSTCSNVRTGAAVGQHVGLFLFFSLFP